MCFVHMCTYRSRGAWWVEVFLERRSGAVGVFSGAFGPYNFRDTQNAGDVRTALYRTLNVNTL